MLQAPAGTEPLDSGCRPHAPTAQELAKQRRAVDPLKMPALYKEVFYGARGQPPGAYGVDRLRLRLFKRFEQPGTGLMGVVLLDEPSGHAVVLFKGMDRPFVERGGLGGALTDLGGVLRARFGGGNPQLPGGDDAYTEALCEPAIRSVEMVGYSMGSQVANYLAVKYGAHAVVFADMGIDGTLLRRHAGGDLATTRAGARERIVSLSLGGDLIVRIFGVGEVIGTVVPLPGGLAGALHQPEIYAQAADEMIRQLKRPDDALAAAGTGARPSGRTLQRRAPGP
ncbi:hypothetical protein [Ideonella sp.]|uniref:hypothetical protein n=1 Tax=Ideonella sp. TaxID=1929293 RepID=UPI0035B0D5A9